MIFFLFFFWLFLQLSVYLYVGYDVVVIVMILFDVDVRVYWVRGGGWGGCVPLFEALHCYTLHHILDYYSYKLMFVYSFRRISQ